MNLENLLKKNSGTIIDVRSPEEFRNGNVENSINIPLNEIMDKIETLLTYEQPLILCCASGNRSGMAYHYLAQRNIECINAGSYLDILELKTKLV